MWMKMLSAVLAIIVCLAARDAVGEEASPRPFSAGLTTKVLAIGHGAAVLPPPGEFRTIMMNEVRETLQLYLKGKIDQFYHRPDGDGMVFILNAASVQEAQALLQALPLSKAHLMTFDLIPLGPSARFRLLLPTEGDAAVSP